MSGSTIYNETELLQQLSKGSDYAFRRIFDLYKDRFYGVALKMSNSQWVAEEIVQEVFVTIWKKRDKLINIDKPSSYLFTVFYRTLYTHFKKEARENQLKANLNEPGVNEPFSFASDTTYMTTEAQYELMEKAIAALPEQQAMVFKLSKQQGLSREEIAQKMGLSPNTVRNHLAQAIQTIKKATQQGGFFVICLLLFCDN